MGIFKPLCFFILCSFCVVEAQRKSKIAKEKIISCNICGRFNKNLLESKGKAVEDPTMYPWLVALHKLRNYKWEYGCMGSVISSWYILTAAHCIERWEAKGDAGDGYCNTVNNTVELCYYTPEEIKFAFTQDQGSMLYLKAAEIHPHPQYRVKQPGFDIALVKVDEEIYCTSTVSPICLSTGWRMDFKKVPAILAGWGKNHTRSKGRMKNLKHTLMDVSDHQNCTGIGMDVNILCATGERYKGASCHGDSGGPLMRYCGNTVYAIGVLASGGLVCSLSESDSFTRVFFYKDWIKTVVNLTHIVPYGDTFNETLKNETCKDPDPRNVPDSTTAETQSYDCTLDVSKPTTRLKESTLKNPSVNGRLGSSSSSFVKLETRS